MPPREFKEEFFIKKPSLWKLASKRSHKEETILLAEYKSLTDPSFVFLSPESLAPRVENAAYF